MLRGWAQEVCSLHRGQHKQHMPSREQCSFALGPHEKGVTWDLWRRWQHHQCRGFLNPGGQGPAVCSHCPLRENKLLAKMWH